LSNADAVINNTLKIVTLKAIPVNNLLLFILCHFFKPNLDRQKNLLMFLFLKQSYLGNLINLFTDKVITTDI